MGFPENLKKWRLIRGYSRREMAIKLDIGEGSYGFYEQDRARPDVAKLLIIAETLQVSTDELLGFHVDEYTRCKNFWEECGYRIEEGLGDCIEIQFNERVEQVTVKNGKTTVREYEYLPLKNKEEFMRLTRAVNDRLDKQLRASRASLFNLVIERAYDELGLVTETEDGTRTYRVKVKQSVQDHLCIPRLKQAADGSAIGE